jgi:hypothetical protein
MKIPTSIHDLFSRDSAQGKSWPSIVMLLRHEKNLSVEDLSKLADAAWGMTSAQGRISPSVVDAGNGSVIFQLAPTIFFSFHQVTNRYSSPAQQNQPLNDAVRKMWEEHIVWCAVDAPERYGLPDKQRRECYMLLFHLVAKLWDSNVCGLYLPAEDNIAKPVIPPHVPNHGDLIASIKRAGANFTTKKEAMPPQPERSSQTNI